MNIAKYLNVNGRLLDLSTPCVMGILNLTPDSFYVHSRMETDEAIVLGENDREYGILKRLGAGIAEALGPSGLIDADVIMDEKSLKPYVIDINARFGGGYPFSHLAGADVPKAYVLFAEGRAEEAEKYFNTVPGTHGYKEIVVKA